MAAWRARARLEKDKWSICGRAANRPTGAWLAPRVPTNADSGPVDPALLTNHLACAGSVATAQPSDQQFLAKPAI
jgi:hypothetical protein